MTQIYPKFPATPKKGWTAGITIPTLGPPQWTTAQAQNVINQGNPAFWYNYVLEPFGVVVPNAPNCPFVPMFWDLAGNQYPGADPFNNTTIGKAVANAGTNGWILFLNEPDLNGTTVAAAITAWEELVTDPRVIAANITCVAPAASTLPTPGSWFDQWYTGVTHKPTEINVHAYASDNASAATMLNQIYARYASWRNLYTNARFWLTEWGILPTIVGGTVPIAHTQALMNLAIPKFDSDATMRYHGWWLVGPSDIPATVSFPSSGLFDNSALIRPEGSAYLAVPSFL